MSETDHDVARRVQELRAFAREVPVVPILVQPDPDPDGMAGALGIRTVLHRSEQASPIVSLGAVTRPENRRMAELLGLQVIRLTREEVNGFKRVIAVDTQPSPAESPTRFAVIDHHPPRDGYTADFVDIRPELGAASTMITQYLREAGEHISPRLATALIYGIRTDTDVLWRGTTREDIEAYAFLQELADQELLRRIGRPAFSMEAVVAVGRAVSALRTRDDLAVAYAGRLDDKNAHVLPNVADFCLAIEGVSWAAVGGRIGDELAVNIRTTGSGLGAGDLARAMAEEEGMGGGHHAMARVALRLDPSYPVSDEPGDEGTVAWLLERVVAAMEALRALR